MQVYSLWCISQCRHRDDITMDLAIMLAEKMQGTDIILVDGSFDVHVTLKLTDKRKPCVGHQIRHRPKATFHNLYIQLERNKTSPCEYKAWKLNDHSAQYITRLCELYEKPDNLFLIKGDQGVITLMTRQLNSTLMLDYIQGRVTETGRPCIVLLHSPPGINSVSRMFIDMSDWVVLFINKCDQKTNTGESVVTFVNGGRSLSSRIKTVIDIDEGVEVDESWNSLMCFKKSYLAKSVCVNYNVQYPDLLQIVESIIS